MPGNKLSAQNLKGSHRKSDYHPDYDKLARQYGLLGLDADGIAKALMISRPTLKRWMSNYDSFRTSLLEGKLIADAKVAGAFFKTAIGYWTTKETAFVSVIDGVQCAEIVKTRVYIGPSDKAALNWLKNRQPELWSDKKQIEHSGDMIVTMDLNGGDAGKNETGQTIDLEENEEGLFELDEPDE